MKKIATLLSSSFFSLSLVACSGSSIEITASSNAEDIYQAKCSSCHEGGFKGWMTDAPKTGDKEAWASRTEKGVEGMTLATIAGIGKMPAKGSCTNCTDEQIKATVELMSGRSL